MHDILRHTLKSLLWILPTQLQRNLTAHSTAPSAAIRHKHVSARMAAVHRTACQLLLRLSQRGVEVGAYGDLWIEKLGELLGSQEAGWAAEVLVHVLWVRLKPLLDACIHLRPCSSAGRPCSTRLCLNP
jgi:hypothetical protein